MRLLRCLILLLSFWASFGDPVVAYEPQGIERCSREIRMLGSQPSAIYKGLLSKITDSDPKAVSEWITTMATDFSLGKFEDLFSEGQQRHLVLALGSMLHQSPGLVREGPQMDAARALKKILLSGYLESQSLREPIRSDLWKALDLCPFDGSRQSMTFCGLIYDSLILSYPANEISHPDILPQLEDVMDRIDLSQPKEEILYHVRQLSRLKDFLIISPIDRDRVEKSLVSLFYRVDRAQNLEIWNRLNELAEEMDRQKTIAVAAARLLGSRGMEEHKILLGEGLHHQNGSGDYYLKPRSIDEKRKRALDLLGFLSTQPEYTRLYMDSFLRTVGAIMPHDPIRAQNYLKRVFNDLKQSLKRDDLNAEQRAALSISLDRLERYWRPQGSRSSD